MFISTAYAQATGSLPIDSASILSFLPWVFLIFVFYFLMIRPQNKRAQEHAHMLETLRRGDKIVTTGGFHATITHVAEDGPVTVELGEGTAATLEKASIVQVLVRASDAPKAKPKGNKPAPKKGK